MAWAPDYHLRHPDIDMGPVLPTGQKRQQHLSMLCCWHTGGGGKDTTLSGARMLD